MSSQIFHFKQFDVCHEQTAMKVGTDGVLLGLVPESTGNSILDIGTGSGLVALLLAQRYAQARIVGIEIDSHAAQQASLNFEVSPWSSRLTCICADIVHFQTDETFDWIVSNPPYYEYSPKTSSDSRNKARLTETLNHIQLITSACKLLAKKGSFTVILPINTVENFIEACWLQNLFLKERVLIQTKKGKPHKRAILTFQRTYEPCRERELVLMREDGSRSEEYQHLIQDFFTK